MKNLYKRLGILSGASMAELRSAIESCRNQAIKADAEHVLLNPKRKEIYDRNHTTLCQIGDLRAGMGQTHSRQWLVGGGSDFESPAPRGSQIERLHAKLRHFKTNEPAKQQEKKSEEVCGGCLIIILLAAAIVFTMLKSDESATTAAPRNDSARLRPPERRSPERRKPSQPRFNEPIQPMPQSGVFQRHHSKEELAPFGIKTTRGSNYLVKLVSVTGVDVMSVFVRGGDPVDIHVPLGTYEVKYASGKTWYGPKHLFGPSTGYSRAESTFNFRSTADGYSGYTITLYQVTNGNLETETIRPEDF